MGFSRECHNDKKVNLGINYKDRGLLEINSVKGTVSVNTSNPPCKGGHVLITKVLKVCLIKHELEINVYHF